LSGFFTAAFTWLRAHADLVLPLVLALGIAWGDVRTRRIPNYLTFGGALAGLGFQWGYYGWAGLASGLLGLGLGFFLLILPYLKGGMGAGDVKALAALGAWLGPRLTLQLFIYMGLSGGLLILAVLWWRGLLWLKVRQVWVFLANWVLCRPHGAGPAPGQPSPPTEAFPYGIALALGMALLFGFNL
jgi:prepilin peptidase CpaA